ncbi:MAG: right-handed parallel beta-helix repeat-containing protein [Verrucomicrobia bacterium]|nr:right-handed parallel beta-helix repeat-containing protein [Verrucomicrobiota bacterium]
MPGNLALRYPEGTRRELLFVNKQPVTQVVSLAELAENTYYVDEANNRILFFPAFGVDPNAALTEIGVRPLNIHGEDSKLLRVFRVNNFRMSGLRFEHAAAASLSNDSAVALRGSSNIIIEDCDLMFNNGFGLSITAQGDTPTANVIIRNVRSNHNGALGMDAGGVQNLLMTNIELSYNNWRGALWGATGWAPCGFKYAFLNGALLQDFRLTQNHASGGWLDAGNANVLVERFYSVNNFRAGLSLEANFGPIVIRDSVFYGNTVGINGFDNSNVLIENSWIFGNSTGQIRMGGSTTLTPEELAEYTADWALDRQMRRHIPRDWTVVDSFVGALPPGSPYIYAIDVRGGTLLDEEGLPRYRDFPDTFLSRNVSYYHPNGATYNGFPNLIGQTIAFVEWETLFTTAGEGNVFVSTEVAEGLMQEALDLVGLPLTGFTGAIATAPVVQVEALSPYAFENGPVPATFRITRTEGDDSGPLLVTFLMTGTAVAGVDYEHPGDRVQIEAGESYADVMIVPIQDGTPSFAKTVRLELQPDLDGLYRLTGTRNALVHLIDEDALSMPAIQATQPTGGASDAFSVQLFNPSSVSVAVEAPAFDRSYVALKSDNLDGPQHVWNSIASTGRPVVFNWLVTNRDGVSASIPLGFDFPFYGNTFSQVYVHSNGFVSFSPLNATQSYASHIQLPSDHVNANPNTIAGFLDEPDPGF